VKNISLKGPIHIPEKREALLAITIAAMIWGANAPISKWTLQFISVETLAFIRFYFAFIIFYLIFKPNLKIAKKDIPLMFLCGFIGISIHIPLLYIGLTLTGAINAAIIASSVPILTLFFSRFFLKEKISKKFIIGGLLGLFGVIFIILEPLFEEGLSNNLVGNLLLLGAVVSFIIYEIISKKLTKKNYHATTITTYSYLIGFISFLPFYLMDITKNGIYFLNSQTLIGIFYILFFSSLIAIPLWQWGISKLEISRVGFFLYLDPVVAFIVAFFLLGEIVTVHMLIGALFIFIGLYIAENTLHFPHFHLYHAHMKKHKG
jgi:drug/metabolite transporter (DMT)-like permease